MASETLGTICGTIGKNFGTFSRMVTRWETSRLNLSLILILFMFWSSQLIYFLSIIFMSLSRHALCYSSPCLFDTLDAFGVSFFYTISPLLFHLCHCHYQWGFLGQPISTCSCFYHLPLMFSIHYLWWSFTDSRTFLSSNRLTDWQRQPKRW